MKVTKELNTNKGITLIALVITIIVMLILVAVTISMAVNGGLFNYAGKAVGDTKNALDTEQELGNGKIQVDGKWYSSIDDYLSGKELIELPEGLKVGDYVNYTPTAGTYKVADGTNGTGYTTTDGYQTFTTETGDSALKWRVLSIDEETGQVEIVAATASQTETMLYLKKEDGYNHAVDILNDLCETLYSKTENGIKVAEARSIKIEDINTKITYDYKTYEGYMFGYNDIKQLSTYGTKYMKYPNLYNQEIGYGSENTFNTTGLKGSEGKNDGVTDERGVTKYSTVTGSTDGNTVGTDPYITYTNYSYSAEDYLNTNLGINTAPAELLNVGTTYWLASRSVSADSSYALFNVRCMYSDGYVGYSDLFYSSGGGFDYGNAVRPVVSLGANATLTKDLANSTESTTYWNIEF